MRRFATVAALSLFAACNARGLDFADFDALPLLERSGSTLYDGKLTITDYHNNKVTNGLSRSWFAFHVKECGGALPDATNMTLMCCETVRPIFRGDDKAWEKLTRYERERYSQTRILKPWRPLPEAEFFKLREEYVICGMCISCDMGYGLPKRHALFSATVDTEDNVEYDDFTHGHMFYIVCEFEANNGD